MTWLGWLFAALSILGMLSKINEIGKPREPVTAADVSALLVVNGLMWWGLLTVGVR